MVSLICLVSSMALGESTVREWDFRKESDRWTPCALIHDPKVEGNALAFRTDPGDVMLVSPVFEGIPTSPWQHIELTMESDVSGAAEFFWTNTTETPYQGFSPGKETHFEVITGGERVYRVPCYWQAEGKIVRLRLDLPEARAAHYRMKSIRIVDEAPPEMTSLPVQSPTLVQGRWAARVSIPFEACEFVSLRVSCKGGGRPSGVLSTANSKKNGLHSIGFALRADGRAHTYNFPVAGGAANGGEVCFLALSLPPELEGTRVESVSAGNEPLGPPDLEIVRFLTQCGVPRAGRPARISALFRNHGGDVLVLPRPRLSVEGATSIVEESVPGLVEYGPVETCSWLVTVAEPGSKKAVLEVPGMDRAEATIAFEKALPVSKLSGVPTPRPARTPYRVGAYYFPGWQAASSWEPIQRYPERRPFLGWYREGDPEVADWHIRWAVEHGISFFLYDWYWDRGTRILEHGIHSGLFHARYQDLIQFCLLYANHNSPGSHSAEDFRAMTRFWIDNYFRRPNYVRVQDRPMVVFFAPSNPIQDMGIEAVKKSFDEMREMCRDAGVGGLYLVACAHLNPHLLGLYRDAGFDAVSGYNWPGLNMTAEERVAQRASFARCAEGYREEWRGISNAGLLKLIPPVSGGWDSRPWHGEAALQRYDRTPEAFERHLRDAKAFLDAEEMDPKLAMLFIEAWNEWGEGSYIEPHEEYGFGYLEAIRRVFAPESPRPEPLLPEDVGLGPYDVPRSVPTTQWVFEEPGATLGWTGNVEGLRSEGGRLRFTTRGGDPRLTAPSVRLWAREAPRLILRLRATKDLRAQVFWGTLVSPESEQNSVRFDVPASSEIRELYLDLSRSARWRGRITSFRLDPGDTDGTEVEIESIRFAGPP